MHGAVEFVRFGEEPRRAQQHRGMPVMAAGVHLAVIHRAMVEFVAFLDVKRVHIGAQPDGAVRITALERAHDAGLAQAAIDRQPPGFKPCGDDIGGAVFRIAAR